MYYLLMQTSGHSGELGLQVVEPAQGELAIRKRAASALIAMQVGELSDNELTLLATMPAGVKPVEIKSLRASHHRLAWLLASGMKAVEVAQLTGYSQSRISILQNDPAFCNLLDFYEKRQDEIRVCLKDKLRYLTADALEVIHERLLESPDAFSVSQLTELMKAGADRTDAPPISKTVAEDNKTLTLHMIKEIRQRVEHAHVGTVKTISTIDPPTS